MAVRRRKPKSKALPPVSLGVVVRENLPYTVVYYPNHYGTFFAFARDYESSPVLCMRARPAVDNYMALRVLMAKQNNSNSLRGAPLDDWFFPSIVSELSLENKDAPLLVMEFVKHLCHRCNLATPTLRYCHEMYGVQFVQYYGWYINQVYLRLGIHPSTFDHLPAVCPPEFQQDINALRKAQIKFQKEEQRLMQLAQGPKRSDIGDDEITYWRNVREEEAQTMIALRREANLRRRDFTKKIENITRKEFGFRKVGEGWVSETILYQIVARVLPDQDVRRHFRPDWLKGLELDIYLPSLQLAFEYQGQQHFHPIRAWGGVGALKQLQARDTRKAKLCKEQGVRLITVDYTEPLSETYIRDVLVKNSIDIA